jgi:predicted nucleotide-binding protein
VVEQKENEQKENLTQQVFVAYAYTVYDKKDYRRVFSNLEKAYGVKFIFADERITNMHILQKIISYIRGSDFSLFDISSWNPNVTLELGIALAMSADWYICFNPDKTELSEVPSDIRGIDRIQYSGFADLEDKLTVLLEQ